MSAVAFLILAMGAWLLESALKNRSPIKTLLDVVQNPTTARATANAGSAITQPLPGTPGGAQSTLFGGPTGIAVAYARQQIGKPYQWGATGPDAYDCSGLVWQAYRQAGILGPVREVTQTLILKGTKVDRADLQFGDLVFPDLGHVQIYTENGNIVEAATDGVPIHEVPMWGFMTARRLV